MQDIEMVYGIIAGICILSVLVYLMYREGSADAWKEISRDAKEKIREKR